MDEPRGAEDGEHRSPLERTVEVFVYAPLGALLDAPRLFPQAVARGRREVEGVGEWLGRRVRGFHGEATAGLRGLARRGDDAPPPAPVVRVVPDRPAPVPDVDDASPAVDVDELAIPDYDSLSASQVVPRLTGLGAEELELVRRYEAGGRGRRTILSRIAQLQQG
jgi:hypothetical protein